jgi:peptide/nickel transport system permease protein
MTFAASVLGVLLLFALIAGWLGGTPQLAIQAGHLQLPVDAPFGQQLGWWALATRRVLIAVAAVVAMALPVGCLLGAVAALGPGVLRGLLTRAVELSGALPSLIAVGLWQIATGSATLASFIAIVILLKGIETARLVADQTSRVMKQPYVLAALTFGSSKRRTFRVHVVPQLWPALAVNAGSTAAYVVGLEGALSFVGLGPTDGLSWGALLGYAARQAEVSWPLVWACLLSITLTTISLYTICRPRGG